MTASACLPRVELDCLSGVVCGACGFVRVVFIGIAGRVHTRRSHGGEPRLAAAKETAGANRYRPGTNMK